jgi:hypothetical protein
VFKEGILIKLIFAVFLALALGSCSEKDKNDPCDISDNVYAPTVVSYSVSSGAVSWANASESSYYAAADGSRAWTITWFCADYEGRNNQYVQLTFWDWNDGSGWELYDEYVAGGICEEGC